MYHPIKIANITKAFSGKKILDDISFEVKKNEIFGFVGLNGVGKTTTIKIILDLLEKDGGNVEVFGKDTILPQSREDLAYLPEKFHPSMQLKGVEFLKFVTGLHKKTLDLTEAKKIAKILDLDEAALDIKISKYSKGMTQKLGLLGTFLSKASLIILDEPMSGLDPIARMNLKAQLIKYKKEGHAIFFSSHILSDVDEICDRIAILSKTKLIFVGKPEEFKKTQKETNLEKAFVKAVV
jgi:ABC-2 type transport system ATP-binding protein